MKVVIVSVVGGWQFVGVLEDSHQLTTLSKCKNIHEWGTERGLGELVNGPTDKTVLFDVGRITIPTTSIQFWIDCKDEAWNL